MSKYTNIYNFYILENGDIWYSSTDRNNMLSVENSLYGLTKFVGNGVIEGWEITAVYPISSQSSEIQNEINLMLNSEIDSEWHRQYENIGKPALDDEEVWKQIIRVSPGKGIVGPYIIKTDIPIYIRLNKYNNKSVTYTIWADISPCTISCHNALLTVTDSFQEIEDYNATYIGEVDVIPKLYDVMLDSGALLFDKTQPDGGHNNELVLFDLQLPTNSSFSISLWYCNLSFEENNQVLFSGNAFFDPETLNYNGIEYVVNDGLAGITSNNSSIFINNGGFNVSANNPLNNWDFLVIIYNNNNKKIYCYRNAVLINSFNVINPIEQIGNIMIGYNNGIVLSDLFNQYYGIIDELVIWNKILTQNEIEFFYNNGNGRITYKNMLNYTPNDFLGIWHFDEIGDIAFDELEQHNGLLIGKPDRIPNARKFSYPVFIDEIYQIKYSEKRKELKHLKSEIENVLQFSLYSHVHDGGPYSPSKINLNTDYIIKIDIPQDKKSINYFTIPGEINLTKYGIPVVKLNNQILPKNEYYIDIKQNKLYLKNSLNPNDDLKLILPLTEQKKFVINTKKSKIDSGIIYLQEENNDKNSYWDTNIYINPKVYLKDKLQNPDTYILNPIGYIAFTNPDKSIKILDSSLYNDNDLYIIVDKIHNQIEGVLSGKRIENIDASTITQGKLDIDKIVKLDHFGSSKIMIPAKLKPYLKLINAGDHRTYYPLIDGLIQYNDYITVIYQSVNFNKQYLVGTKNGLYETDNFIDFVKINSWTADMGVPYQIIDNLLGNVENIFKTTYIVTEDKKIYYTKNKGRSWKRLKMPIVENEVVTPTVFFASTDYSYVDTIETIECILYLGTKEHGLFCAKFDFINNENGWVWEPIDFPLIEYTEIVSLTEIATSRVLLDTFGRIIIYDRTVFVLSKNDKNKTILFISKNYGQYDLLIDNVNSPLFNVLNNAVFSFNINKNRPYNIGFLSNINNQIYIALTHNSKYPVQIQNKNQTITYWEHPLVDLLNKNIVYLSNYIIYDYTRNNDELLNSDVDIDVINKKIYLYKDYIGETQLSTAPINSYFLLKNFNVSYLINYDTNEIMCLNTVYKLINNTFPYEFEQIDLPDEGYIKVHSNNSENDYSFWYFITEQKVNIINNKNIIIKIKKWKELIDIIKTNININNINTNCKYIEYNITNNKNNIIFLNNYNINNSYYYNQKIIAHIIQYYDYENNSIYWNKIKYKIIDLSNNGLSFQYIPTTFLFNNKIYYGSINGLWILNINIDNFDVSFERIFNQYIYNELMMPEPTIFDAVSLEKTEGWKYTDYNNNIKIYDNQSQSFRRDTIASPNKYYVYEKDFKEYYIEPWDSNAIVFIYDNNKYIDSNYKIFPQEGKIVFDTSRNKNSNIYVTLYNQGAYLYNVGNIPHQEIPNAIIEEQTPYATLAKDLNINDQFLEANKEFDSDVHYISLIYNNVKERLHVALNIYNKKILYIISPRTVNFIFPAYNTHIFLNKIVKLKGIEDYISMIQSNQPYYLNSTLGSNIMLLTMVSCGYYGYNFISKYEELNYVKESEIIIDHLNSFNKGISLGVFPDDYNKYYNPNIVYKLAFINYLLNIVNFNEKLFVGTEYGIWEYTPENNFKWKHCSKLNNAKKINFIKYLPTAFDFEYNNNKFYKIYIGADNGLWKYNYFNQSWEHQILFNQDVYDIYEISNLIERLTIIAKNDGVSCFLQQNNKIISNYIDILDGQKVFNILKQVYKYRNDFISVYYCSSENGFYCFKIDDNNLSTTSKILLNNIQCYQSISFEINYQIKNQTIIKNNYILVLTENGIYLFDNTVDNILKNDIHPIMHVLQNYKCNCGVVLKENDKDINIFVGTDKGIFMSEDCINWVQCQHPIEGSQLNIFDIKIKNNTNDIYIATNKGIFISNNKGFNWKKLEYDFISNGAIIYSPIKALSQTFKTPNNNEDLILTKIYLYLNPINLYNVQYNCILENIDNNTIIYNEIINKYYNYDGFKTVVCGIFLYKNTNYRIIIDYDDINKGVDWGLIESSYIDGKAYINYNGALETDKWIEIPNKNFMFYVVCETNEQNKIITKNIDFTKGDIKSLIVSNNNELILDVKYAIFMILDNSKSMNNNLYNYGNDGNHLYSHTQLSYNILNKFINYSNQKSYINYWVFGDTLQQKTNNFENISTANNIIVDIPKGNKSNYYDTVFLAINLFTPRQIIDVIKNDFYSSMNVIQYLYNNNLINYQELYNYYDSISNKTVICYISPKEPLQINKIYYIINSKTNDLFVWDIQTYKYVDVIIDDVIIDKNDYEINNNGIIKIINSNYINKTNIKIIFRTDWDGVINVNNILNNDILLDYVLNKWVNSFIPIFFVISDANDNNSKYDLENIGIVSQLNWNDNSINVVVINYGNNSNYNNARNLVENCKGDLYVCMTTDDFNNILTQLEQNEQLFSGYWTNTIIFDKLTYIKNIEALAFYNIVENNDFNPYLIKIQIKYTFDKLNWLGYYLLEINNINNIDEFTKEVLFNKNIEAEIYGIQFDISIKASYNSITLKNNYIKYLRYNIVEPIQRYIVTQPINTNGTMFEYLLTFQNDNKNIKYGIIRSEQVIENKYSESILLNNKNVLINRQYNLIYQSSSIIGPLLVTDITDYTKDFIEYATFQVWFDKEQQIKAYWDKEDQIIVRSTNVINGQTIIFDIPSSYIYGTNEIYGHIYMDPFPENIITVYIYKLAKLNEIIGEPTYTFDNQIYYTVNGIWPSDATIVVLINGKIVLQGYIINKNNNSIIFYKPLKNEDVVTVFIDTVDKIKLTLTYKEYFNHNKIVNLNGMGLMYTTYKKLPIVSLANQITYPIIKNNQVILQSYYSSLFYPMYVYYELDNNYYLYEKNTKIEWYKNNIKIEHYNNRNIIAYEDIYRTHDDYSIFDKNDVIFVIVYPSYDGINYSYGITSNSITANLNSYPMVFDINFVDDNNTIKTSIIQGENIYIKYNFYDKAQFDNIIDNSIIEWYKEKDNIPFYSYSMSAGNDVKKYLYSELTNNIEFTTNDIYIYVKIIPIGKYSTDIGIPVYSKKILLYSKYKQ